MGVFATKGKPCRWQYGGEKAFIAMSYMALWEKCCESLCSTASLEGILVDLCIEMFWITPGMILEVLSGSRLGTTHDCYEHLWRCLCSTLIQAIGICKWPRLLCCIWKGGTPVRISTGWFRSPMFHDIVFMMMKQLQLVQPSIYIIYNNIYIAKLTYHLIMYWVQGNEMTTSLGGHHKLLSLGMMVFLL